LLIALERSSAFGALVAALVPKPHEVIHRTYVEFVPFAREAKETSGAFCALFESLQQFGLMRRNSSTLAYGIGSFGGWFPRFATVGG
jgi:hypothetical protein